METAFDICYATGLSLGYTLVDIRGENNSWFRFKDQNNEIILIKSIKTQSSDIGVKDYLTLCENIDKLIIVFKNKAEYYRYVIDKSDKNFKSDLKTFLQNKQRFDLNKCSELRSLKILDLSSARSRYKDLVKRNYLQKLNFILFMASDSIPWGQAINIYVTKAIPENIKLIFKNSYFNQSTNKETLQNRNKRMKGYKNDNESNISSFETKYYEYYQSSILTFDNFYKLWNQKDRSCAYCGISEKQIACLNKDNKIETKRFYSRGKTMEIDKIDPFGEYKKNNIILSCYWCNNAKTDEYSLEEFQPIAKGINCVWNQRLKCITVTNYCSNTVKFPAATYKQKDKKDDNCDKES